ncbi:MAG: glycogen debranching protein GlgX, partial [Bifidobacteriaceae bacterium]|jgi:glycogen operon protein|nr:glycogen debranching protein GlgX [Bifidobacteriaceae bacterium]
VTAGQRYGFRAAGPWDPAAGSRFNPAKLLLDPYGRAIDQVRPVTREFYAHEVGPDLGPVPGPRTASAGDSAPFVPHSVIVPPGDAFDWGGSARPATPWERTVIYEAHVKGLTMTLPGVPEELRGTYAGVAHPAVIDHLTRLGVTAIELLPIHAAMTEPQLQTRGLTNYWGYSTLGFFAPNPAYATATARAAGPEAVIAEVKGMVRLLHKAGLEVILDVVYNHTCEQGLDGPTVCWRGLDNQLWYRHDPGAPDRYQDVTGTGNSLDFSRPEVVAMAVDSLRHWARGYQVDGFRYDLAVTLGRTGHGFSPRHPFLAALQTEPELRGLKHIAEPWDLGLGGWQTGGFPPPMAAWNDHFRGDARRFWLTNPKAQSTDAEGVSGRDLATRLSGSADLFDAADPAFAHGPMGSVNFVTAHDGFTLHDLVSYDSKHNEANGENGRDGTDDNRSWNHGVEGRLHPSAGAGIHGIGIGIDAVNSLRQRSQRNLLATLAFASGVPMLLGGDEIGRSQGGNNNAYCQDSAVTWLDWNLEPWQEKLRDTVAFLFKLRRENPALRPDRFATGKVPDGGTVPDLAWYGPGGLEVTPEEWNDPSFRTFQMLRGAVSPEDRDVLLAVNGSLKPSGVTVPRWRGGAAFALVWDSGWASPAEAAAEPGAEGPARVGAGDQVPLDALTVRLYLTA